MKKLSLINKLIYIVNTLVATCLLLSYLLPYVSPETFPSFAVLSLLVPVLIVINIVFVLYWVFNLKKHFILSTLILSIGYFVTPTLYKITANNSSLNDDLKVMSYNVRMFNHWKWIDGNIPENINDFIQEKSPDILLFQEFHQLEQKDFKFPYKFIDINNKSANIGLAIYSKYPIINQGTLKLKNTANNIIYADIVRKKDTIRIYNLHLQSLQLKTDKENFGQENSNELITSLKKGFKKQAEQTNIFLAHEKNWKGKKIIAGDFNNTAYSWVYKQISANKNDSFVQAGKGFGKTFDYWFPMRIDFILTDKNAIVNKFTSFSVKYSDHYPIQAKINW